MLALVALAFLAPAIEAKPVKRHLGGGVLIPSGFSRLDGYGFIDTVSDDWVIRGSRPVSTAIRAFFLRTRWLD